MTKHQVRISSILLGVLALTFSVAMAVHYGKGPKPASTNAPGETSCVAGNCHNQQNLNSGSGTLSIKGVPEVYNTGEPYTLTITLEQQGQKRWGFQLTALNKAGQPAGDFFLVDEELTQLKQANLPDGTVRQYIEQTLEGSYMGKENGPVSWTVGWKAPAEPLGAVYFYCAANAANFNKRPWGDFIYTRIDTTGAPESGE